MWIYFSYFGTNEFCGFYPWALYMYQLWHTVYMCTFLKKLKFVIAHWVKGQFLYKSSTRHYTQVYVNWNSLQRLSCIIFISLKWKLYAMCIATILLNWHSTVSHFIWTTMLLPTAFQVFFCLLVKLVTPGVWFFFWWHREYIHAVNNYTVFNLNVNSNFINKLDHLSWKLKRVSLISFCPSSVCLSVCPSVSLSIPL